MPPGFELLRTAVLLKLGIALLLVFACAGAWSAQALRTYPDTVGDNPGGLAHDITSVTISIDAAQVITTRVNTSRSRNPNFEMQDYILLWLDTDPNSPGEGSGPEYRISVSGGIGLTALLERWVGPPYPAGAWVEYNPPSFSGQFAPGGMEARFLRADLGIGNAFRFHALSRWSGQYDDWLPNDTLARETYDVVAPVTVSKSGSGTGTVKSSPAGIDCGSSCSANFVLSGSVTLEAVPDAATSDFAGWGGACSGTSRICTVTVDDAKSVTAQFVLGSETLTVASSGRGTVRSSPRGISCGSVCEKEFLRGSVVSLNAKPAPGARFVRWTGCSGRRPTCSVPMDSDRTVRAIFKQYPHVSMAWSWNSRGSRIHLIASPRPRASARVSFRCVRSCSLLGRSRTSADVALPAGGIVEMRATRPGFIGVSRLLSKRGSKIVSSVPKCLPPGQRRPVPCRLLGVG